MTLLIRGLFALIFHVDALYDMNSGWSFKNQWGESVRKQNYHNLLSLKRKESGKQIQILNQDLGSARIKEKNY